jgi:pimeloyl-ACP methyl ester carboxylesterase
MPFAEAGGCRLYYETYGPKPGTAPAIVFAHGAGGNHLSWWQQVPHFRDRYTCVVFDHRGFGQSIDPPDGPGGAVFADDLRALLDHVNIERANLVAQSMGGWTCLRFAIRWPERVDKLVMADTHGGLSSPAVREVVRRLPDWERPPSGAHVAAGARMAREQPALSFLYSEIDALNPPRTREELGRLLASAGSPSQDEVAALHIRVLFVVGEEDPLIPPPMLEAAAESFRRARVVRVPEAGHSVYFERAARFNQLVEEFLASEAVDERLFAPNVSPENVS